MKPPVKTLFASGLLVGLVPMLGSASASAAMPTRTIEVKMVDIAFEPMALTVATGDRVTFVFINAGKIKHDAFVGNTNAQAEHERVMRKTGNDSHGHDSGSQTRRAVTVKAGRQAKLTYTFKKAGTIEIGCHQPGHYDTGMKISIAVA